VSTRTRSVSQSINFDQVGLSNKLLPQGPHTVTVIYKTRPGYESRNRSSFSRFLKARRDGARLYMPYADACISDAFAAIEWWHSKTSS